MSVVFTVNQVAIFTSSLPKYIVRIYAIYFPWFITSMDELPSIYDAHKVYNSICSKVRLL